MHHTCYAYAHTDMLHSLPCYPSSRLNSRRHTLPSTPPRREGAVFTAEQSEGVANKETIRGGPAGRSAATKTLSTALQLKKKASFNVQLDKSLGLGRAPALPELLLAAVGHATSFPQVFVGRRSYLPRKAARLLNG